MVLKLYLAHGFPQCLGAVEGSHVNMKKPNKRKFTGIVKIIIRFNVQAAAGYQYCFFDVLIK